MHALHIAWNVFGVIGVAVTAVAVWAAVVGARDIAKNGWH